MPVASMHPCLRMSRVAVKQTLTALFLTGMLVIVCFCRSVSAPDLLNQAAMQEAQKKAQPKKQHSSLCQHATPPVPRHRKHLTMGHAPPGTPGESAANTPSSSRASTPPRRRGMDDSFYIGMAAA